MSYISDEIGDQPAAWRKAADRGRDLDQDRFRPGWRLAVVGCGTSFHMAQARPACRPDQWRPVVSSKNKTTLDGPGGWVISGDVR